MEGYIDLGELDEKFIAIAIANYIYEGDREGVAIAREFRDNDGNPPPIDDIISAVLIAEGRLLTA